MEAMHHPRPGAAACEAVAAEVDSWWGSRNLRDRRVWNLAVIVSADKATSFTVPKIVIFEDVVLAFKCAPDEYYAKIQTLNINS